LFKQVDRLNFISGKADKKVSSIGGLRRVKTIRHAYDEGGGIPKFGKICVA